jgi:hypothetical protein
MTPWLISEFTYLFPKGVIIFSEYEIGCTFDGCGEPDIFAHLIERGPSALVDDFFCGDASLEERGSH